MIQLTDSHWAVEVPDDASDFLLLGSVERGDKGLFWKQPNARFPNWKPLLTGTWQYLFTTKEATEEHAKQVVQNVGVWFDLFPNYDDEEYPFDTGIQSLQSLLRAKGLDMNKNYAIIQKLNDNESCSMD